MPGATMATPPAQGGETSDSVLGADSDLDMNDLQIRALLADDIQIISEGSPAAPAAESEPAPAAPEGDPALESDPDAQPEADPATAGKPKAKPEVPVDWQESVNKRIGEATAKATAAQAEADRVKAEATAAKAEAESLKAEVEVLRAEQQGRAQGQHPAAFAESETAFHELVRKSYDRMTAAKEAVEAGGYTRKNGTVIAVDELNKIVAEENRFLTVEKDTLLTQVRARQANLARVAESHAAYKGDIDAVLTQHPQLRHLPNAGDLALRIALGDRLLKAKAATTKGAPPRPAGAPPAPVGGSVGAGAPSLPGSTRRAPTTEDLEREYYSALERR